MLALKATRMKGAAQGEDQPYKRQRVEGLIAFDTVRRTNARLRSRSRHPDSRRKVHNTTNGYREVMGSRGGVCIAPPGAGEQTALVVDSTDTSKGYILEPFWSCHSTSMGGLT